MALEPRLDPYEGMPAPSSVSKPSSQDSKPSSQDYSTARSILRAFLTGILATAGRPKGTSPFLSLAGGAAASLRYQNAAKQAAQEYAQKQLDREAAEEDRQLRRALLNAQIEREKKPDKPEKEFANAPWYEDPKYKDTPSAIAARAKANTITEPVLTILNPDGSTSYVPKSQALGQVKEGPKPPSESEKKSADYYGRASAANKIIEDLMPAVAGNQMAIAQLRHAPNIAQTSEQRRIRAAEREFAIKLREESGGAITEPEIANDIVAYFPQVGDDPETLKNKADMRARVLAGMKLRAGKALGGGGGGAAKPTHRWNPATGDFEAIP